MLKDTSKKTEKEDNTGGCRDTCKEQKQKVRWQADTKEKEIARPVVLETEKPNAAKMVCMSMH